MAAGAWYLCCFELAKEGGWVKVCFGGRREDCICGSVNWLVAGSGGLYGGYSMRYIGLRYGDLTEEL